MINIGVIGAGHLGKIHLTQMKEIADFRITGFYDKNKQTATEVSAAFGIKSFENPMELIEQSAALDIVSPTPTHYEYAVEAINKGKHLFIEKPLAASVDEAEEILKLSQKKNIMVQTGHVERFNPAFVAAAPHLDSPMFIEAHRLAQFNLRGTDVSVIFDLMIHDLDIVLSVVKSEIKSIHASGVSVVSDSPDIANARIEFENGCVANLTASRISVKKMRKARFFQTNAYISIDFLKKKTEVIRLKEFSGEPGPFSLVVELEGNRKKMIYFENPEINDTNAIKSELQQFADAINNNMQPAVTAYDGFIAVKTAHAILEKIKSVPLVV